MREHAARYGAELVNGVVKSIERVQTGFIVRTDSQAIEARTILLAQGVVHHQPRIPQETHARGVAYGLIRHCQIRSEARRDGKECVRTCKSRWAQYHSQKKKYRNK